MTFDIPDATVPILDARTRYKCLKGGRGKGASWTFARYILQRTAYHKKRVLCTREFQNSIRDSVHRLLCDQIEILGLQSLYEMTKDSLKGIYGSEFIFKGLHHNAAEIKSMEGIDICWMEEAEKTSKDSWNVLTPTIRKPESEILVNYNPEDEASETHRRFELEPIPDAAILHMTWRDNPWFPDVLRKEMEYDRRVDPEKFMHVWEGKVKKYLQACIFAKKVRIEAFETPEGVEFYYGGDFGFSNDPTAFGRMFIVDRKLYIDYEAYAVGVEIDDLPAFMDVVPDIRKWKIRADSQRPDTISYLKRQGFDIIGAEKGPGSVEDGIAFLRSFEEIIIHPRCAGAKGDFQNMRWKTNKVTGDILPIPAEGSDHWPDLARYALEPYIKKNLDAADVSEEAVNHNFMPV